MQMFFSAPARGVVQNNAQIRSRRGAKSFFDQFPRRQPVAETDHGKIVHQGRPQKRRSAERRRHAADDLYLNALSIASVVRGPLFSFLRHLQHQSCHPVDARISAADQRDRVPRFRLFQSHPAAGFFACHGRSQISLVGIIRLHKVVVDRIADDRIAPVQRRRGLPRHPLVVPGTDPDDEQVPFRIISAHFVLLLPIQLHRRYSHTKGHPVLRGLSSEDPRGSCGGRRPLAHIAGADMLPDSVRFRKSPAAELYFFQLPCAVGLKRNAQAGGKGEKSGLLFFDIDGCDRADRLPAQAQFFERLRCERPDLLKGFASAASHSQYNAPRNQLQRRIRRALIRGNQNGILFRQTGLLLFRGIPHLQFTRRLPADGDHAGVFAGDDHLRAFLPEKPRRKSAGFPQIVDSEVIVRGKYIHGKQAVHIGRRCEHGPASRDPRKPLRPRICAAQVPRQKRDHVRPLLVHDQNGRIRVLSLQERCCGAHRDPAGTDINEDIPFLEILLRPALKAPLAAGTPDLNLRQQFPLQKSCQLRSGLREVDNMYLLHDLFPLVRTRIAGFCGYTKQAIASAAAARASPSPDAVYMSLLAL